MPTYSYACTDCGDRFDAVQAFSDAALTTCDKCSGRLRKLFGNVGVVFKGSGFYRTDSRDSAKSESNGSSSSSPGQSGESGSSSPSDKPKSSSPGQSSDSGSSSSSTSSTAAAAASS
ncbi:FmdB family zinc ribbon protein [Mycobacterium sp. IDR2000157661]|uniref:FmdB family zinc ribbon protein n=1 Tax=Mycobacterium sp. IDR2000157661 TaxID=2867005 RepID=UPI001EE9E991|nr:FmdB family zinc ribbon protein [Mycobacterium sp. IDR2000157661]ULE31284.1 FmdB family transcriptional regulator [Mycobacterium sp. IDR2000157661]